MAGMSSSGKIGNTRLIAMVWIQQYNSMVAASTLCLGSKFS